MELLVASMYYLPRTVGPIWLPGVLRSWASVWVGGLMNAYCEAAFVGIRETRIGNFATCPTCYNILKLIGIRSGASKRSAIELKMTWTFIQTILMNLRYFYFNSTFYSSMPSAQLHSKWTVYVSRQKTWSSIIGRIAGVPFPFRGLN